MEDRAVLPAPRKENHQHADHVGFAAQSLVAYYATISGLTTPILDSLQGGDVQHPHLDSPSSSTVASELVGQIDMQRWYSRVAHLTSYKSRYVTARDMDKVCAWLCKELSCMPGMQVTIQEWTFASRKACHNVIGTLKGTTRPEEVLIIGAHYDSVSERPLGHAPGAVDNASGTAAVLEIAQLFSLHPPQITLKFVLFTGEEVGLLGSHAFVRENCTHPEWALQFIKDENISQSDDLQQNKHPVQLMINLDMICWRNPEGDSILVETHEGLAPLVRVFEEAAAQFSVLPVQVSFQPWGSDHIPFLQSAIPAVHTANKDGTRYTSYHTSKDDMENVDMDIALNILAMNVAVIARFALEGLNMEQAMKIHTSKG